MNDQRAEFPGLIRTTSATANSPIVLPSTIATNEPIADNGVQRNVSVQAASTVTTSPITNGGLTGRIRRASDGLAEGTMSSITVDQVPSAADELEPGDDFFDMIFRLQVCELTLVFSLPGPFWL